MKIYTYSEEETKTLGRMIGYFMQKEGINVVALFGEMGVGKTVLSKGIAQAFGISEKEITSSSFVIISYYPQANFYHIDLYRVENVANDDIDLWECFENGSCVIEWAERVDELPENTLKITIEFVDSNCRVFNLEM